MHRLLDRSVGPDNRRLRAHLPLFGCDGARMRLGDETHRWREREWLVFDDSFEHEVRRNAFCLVSHLDELSRERSLQVFCLGRRFFWAPFASENPERVSIAGLA